MEIWMCICIWAVVLVLMVILEMSTAQLVSIWFAAGAVVALILSVFDVAFWVQALVFTIVSVVLLVVIKVIIKKKEKPVEGITVPFESMIGEEVVVTKDISRDNIGEIKEKYDRYSAISINEDDSFVVGDRVKIVEIEGNKVKVERI